MKRLILVLMILASLSVREMDCNDDDWYDPDSPWDLFEEDCDGE